MTNELYEWFPQRLAQLGVRRDDVHSREDGEGDSDAHNLQGLQNHVLPPEAGQTLVPDGRQKLLHIRVRHKLRAVTDHDTLTVSGSSTFVLCTFIPRNFML